MISGIVTTTRITHATPAALYSHTPNRDWEADSWYQNECKDVKDIAKQLIENDVGQKLDLIFGGGRRNFLPKRLEGKRTDDLNLIEAWKKKKGENGAVLQNITQLKDWNEEGFALGNKIVNKYKHTGSPPWCRGKGCWTCKPRVSGSIPGDSNLKKFLIWMKIHGLPQNLNKDAQVR